MDLVVATDDVMPMGSIGRSRSLLIDFDRPEWSAARISELKPPPDGVVGVDDKGVIIAAMASHLLGLPANPVAAVRLTRDKAHMRNLLESAGVPQPTYVVANPGEVAVAAASIGFPCVLKPRGLSASRGVIRVDSESEASFAETRIRRIIEDDGSDAEASILVEQFVPGEEVAVEGLLIDGSLEVLAILDKPDPLDGPFFEETLFVTPSRHPKELQSAIAGVTERATRALGLAAGPIHAEIRLGAEGPVVLEVAARSIGGLCGRALTFGVLSETLESVILRSAVGLPGVRTDSAAPAAGVMMLPIPTAGTLVSIDGIDRALAVEGITDVTQTIPNGREVVPLPEGDRYLGFIFAGGASPDDVESSLRTAYAELTVRID